VIHILQFTQIESTLCLCGVIVEVHRALLLEVVARKTQKDQFRPLMLVPILEKGCYN
jgi:hypothetical protein